MTQVTFQNGPVSTNHVLPVLWVFPLASGKRTWQIEIEFPTNSKRILTNDYVFALKCLTCYFCRTFQCRKIGLGHPIISYLP